MTTLQHGPRLGIVVNGTPIPQGSKTAGVVKGRAILRDANSKTLKPWRKAVHDAATDAARYHDPFTGPVRVWLRFGFERPKSHYRTGANAHLLKADAPTFPTGRQFGDGDKLTRAVFDSLTTAGVWGDDSQVVHHDVRKFFVAEHDIAPTAAGVHIIIEEVAS